MLYKTLTYTALVSACFCTQSLAQTTSPLVLPESLQTTSTQVDTDNPLAHSQFDRQGPTIQMAILLDTSNSMDGLINQAREQIWKIINELAQANKDNKEVTLQVALYEYGKSSLPREQGYLQILSPLDNDLDQLSQQLFSLQTAGGDEFAGQVILQSIQQLNWSTHPEDLKLILIAGNESFEQGRIKSQFALQKAQQANIIVNTMYCGGYQGGVSEGWQQAALEGKGKYLNIDINQDVVHIATPYDQDIARYGRQLNDTYFGYGERAVAAQMLQAEQDLKSSQRSEQLMADRSVAKASNQYKSQDWDLVSLYEDNKQAAIAAAKNNNDEFKGLNNQQIEEKLQEFTEQRNSIKDKINQLNQKRQAYITEEKAKSADKEEDFGTVLIKNIKQQAIDRGYQF